MSTRTNEYLDNTAKVVYTPHLMIDRENVKASIRDADINEIIASFDPVNLGTAKPIENYTEVLETFFDSETENFIWSTITSESLLAHESTHQIGFRSEPRKIARNEQKNSDQHNPLNSAYEKINSFLSLEDGWDGEGSIGPKKETVYDTIRFLDNWSNFSILPKPEVMFYGVSTLQFYCEKGKSLGAIEFNEQHSGVYSVLDKNLEFVSGNFDSSSIDEIKLAISNILTVIQSNDNHKVGINEL